jgi:NADPH:quinone reductase-like Zn-dependent oxidoreductase
MNEGKVRESVITRSGGPEVLQVRERASDPLAEGQVRIRVQFAGVNFADLAGRAGIYGPAPKPPFVAGFEVSGVVVEVASGVQRLKVGDRVLAGTRFGGYADEVVVDEGRARVLPPGVSLELGAALTAQYITAYHALTESARARPGEWVLVHAVAGGVGTAATQLCRHLGLEMIGTASSDEKLDYARSQGAKHLINYAREDFVPKVMEITRGRGVDVVLDANGGDSFRKSFKCLAHGGRLIVYGAAELFPRSPLDWVRVAKDFLKQPRFSPFALIERNAGVLGLQVLLLWDDLEVLGREMDELLALLERGVIQPVVDRIFPLEDAAEAHRYLHARRTRGKVLLACR